MGQVCLSDLGESKMVPNGLSAPKWVYVNLDGPKVMPNGLNALSGPK